MSNTEEKKDLAGLTKAKASDRKAAENDILSSLLKAANYRNDEDSIKEVDIKRNGELLFTVHVHPIGEEESQKAYKKARIKKKNKKGQYVYDPENIDDQLRKSWLIYLATTEKDKKEIWGNKEFMQEMDIIDPVDSIDVLLQVGEKIMLVNTIFEISGWADDEDDEIADDEEYAKN